MADNWISPISQAKWQAKSSNGYVVAVVCSRFCSYCKTAEAKVWTTEQWAAYAALDSYEL